jgi:hypothetical protein
MCTMAFRKFFEDMFGDRLKKTQSTHPVRLKALGLTIDVPLEDVVEEIAAGVSIEQSFRDYFKKIGGSEEDYGGFGDKPSATDTTRYWHLTKGDSSYYLILHPKYDPNNYILYPVSSLQAQHNSKILTDLANVAQNEVIIIQANNQLQVFQKALELSGFDIRLEDFSAGEQSLLGFHYASFVLDQKTLDNCTSPDMLTNRIRQVLRAHYIGVPYDRTPPADAGKK